MKGMVFTEFLDFVKQTFSEEMVETIIAKNDLISGGAYTSVGTYDPKEMIMLVTALSKEVQVPAPKLVEAFGEHLFTRFHALFPHFFTKETTTFQFLNGVENYIHVEVRKLYPEAELPHFDCHEEDDKFIMMYTSAQPFADLAEGLIKGCIKYHKENIEVQREDFPVQQGAKTKFTLIKK